MKKFIIGFIVGALFITVFVIGANKILFGTAIPNVEIPKGHVSVTLDLKNEIELEYINLISGSSKQSVSPSSQKQTIITFPRSSEGTFVICYKLKDQKEACGLEHYVEPGYSLIMELTDTGLKTIEHQ